MATSNQTSKKRQRDDRIDFQYTGREVPIDVTHVRLHSSVTEVEYEAFRNCTQLREVVLNEGLQRIGEGAFWGCDRLTKVVFNEGLQMIGDMAFFHCSALESITFPSTVTEIGMNSFSSCNSLKEFVINDRVSKRLEQRLFIIARHYKALLYPPL